MRARVAVALLLVSLSIPASAGAQGRGGNAAGASVAWTAAGAGAGFGVGLWAGLTVFDDAINSDRKVWTTAIVGAGVGAVGGYFLGRALRSQRASPKPAISPRHLTVRADEIAAIVSGFRLHRGGAAP